MKREKIFNDKLLDQWGVVFVDGCGVGREAGGGGAGMGAMGSGPDPMQGPRERGGGIGASDVRNADVEETRLLERSVCSNTSLCLNASSSASQRKLVLAHKLVF